MKTFFPKLHVPYKRKEVNSELIAIPEVKPEFEWVFKDADNVTAVEKIDGENIRVDFNSEGGPIAIYRRNGYEETEHGRVYNLEEIPLWDDEMSHYTEGVANAFGKGWMEYVNTSQEQTHFGELVGPKMQSNRYDLKKHYWVPFGYAHENLVIESYGEYPTDFETISDWFKNYLPPIFYSKMHGGLEFDKAREQTNVEGVIFVRETKKPTHKREMAKLRQSDFKWFY